MGLLYHASSVDSACTPIYTLQYIGKLPGGRTTRFALFSLGMHMLVSANQTLVSRRKRALRSLSVPICQVSGPLRTSAAVLSAGQRYIAAAGYFSLMSPAPPQHLQARTSPSEPQVPQKFSLQVPLPLQWAHFTAPRGSTDIVPLGRDFLANLPFAFPKPNMATSSLLASRDAHLEPRTHARSVNRFRLGGRSQGDEDYPPFPGSSIACYTSPSVPRRKPSCISRWC